MEIDFEFFHGHSPPFADSRRAIVTYKQNKYVHGVLVNHSVLSLPRKSVARLTYHLDITLAIDWDVKPQT